jgi:hypothetical protein
MKLIDRAFYPETIEAIKKNLPIFNSMPAYPLELLWENFSQEEYSAGHMNYSDGVADDFYKWCFSEVREFNK